MIRPRDPYYSHDEEEDTPRGADGLDAFSFWFLMIAVGLVVGGLLGVVASAA